MIKCYPKCSHFVLTGECDCRLSATPVADHAPKSLHAPSAELGDPSQGACTPLAHARPGMHARASYSPPDDTLVKLVALLCREVRNRELDHWRKHPTPERLCGYCLNGAAQWALLEVELNYGPEVAQAVGSLLNRAYPDDYTGIM